MATTDSLPLSVFIVDDEIATRLVTQDVLTQSGFKVVEFESAESCLAALREGTVPDIILLDIEMRGMTGIQMCQTMRTEGFDDPRVIFVSSRDELETRLTAYDAGGNDYIIKPISREELVRKIRVLQRSAVATRSLHNVAKAAKSAAVAAISSAGEVGVILDFLRNSFVKNSPQEVATLFFETLEQYRLNGVLRLKVAPELHYFSTNGECSPLEKAILDRASQTERLFQLGSRLVVNFPSVVFVINNLPLVDEDKTGRLRDHLALLAEGLEARVVSLLEYIRLEKQTEGLLQIMEGLRKTLTEIGLVQTQQRESIVNLNEQAIQEIDLTCVSLDLSLAQEEKLLATSRKIIERYSQLLDFNHIVGDQLQLVQSQLQGLIAIR